MREGGEVCWIFVWGSLMRPAACAWATPVELRSDGTSDRSKPRLRSILQSSCGGVRTHATNITQVLATQVIIGHWTNLHYNLRLVSKKVC